MTCGTNSGRAWIGLALCLAAASLAVFWPVFSNDFVGYDDPIYVADNYHVKTGLTWANLGWAWTTGYAANWHPLTWISHMIDVELFGLNPAGHHATSLVLHTANALLLFLLLVRLTRAPGASFFVAALFALHPLHVESVAWISERKDVLSAFFFFLTLLAYTNYAKATGEQRMANGKPAHVQPSPVAGRRSPFALGWYFLALALFAMGLMSKPMLVTVPCVLLLLDIWPLGRVPAGALLSHRTWLFRLALEKVPFFCLAIISSIVTVLVQREGHAVDLVLPGGLRAVNVVVSYTKYLSKAFWPRHLAAYYPHPAAFSAQWPVWAVGLAALGLGAISVVAVRRLSRQPWLGVGWAWYLGTLAPVIGLVQVGSQAMADRYTYIPLIGIFMIVAWGTKEIFGCGRVSRCLPFIAICALLACGIVSRRQAGFWRNKRALFEHAAAVTSNNAMAHSCLGADYAENGDFKRAVEEFQTALTTAPWLADAHQGLGAVWESLGKTNEAIREYRAAADLRPWYNLPHKRLAAVYWALGQPSNALWHCSEAVRLMPEDFQERINLGGMFWGGGRREDAARQYRIAVNLYPGRPVGHYNLGFALSGLGRLGEAEREFAEAVRLDPDYREALAKLARLLATGPAPELRNGVEAVRLAEHACQLSGNKDLNLRAILDAAYAESGRFADAMAAAEQTRELALAAGNRDGAAAADWRLARYRQGRPLHD